MVVILRFLLDAFTTILGQLFSATLSFHQIVNSFLQQSTISECRLTSTPLHFSALPTELRLKIWGYVFSAHAVVVFIPKHDQSGRKCIPIRSTVDSRASHINREARDTYTRVRQRIDFLGYRNCNPPSSMVPHTTWFDFSNTTFYLRQDQVITFNSSTMQYGGFEDRIHHLAVGWDELPGLLYLPMLLPKFTALRTLLVMRLSQAPPGPKLLLPSTSDSDVHRLAANMEQDDAGKELRGSMRNGYLSNLYLISSHMIGCSAENHQSSRLSHQTLCDLGTRIEVTHFDRHNDKLMALI